MRSDCKICETEKPAGLYATTIKHVYENTTILTLTNFPVFICAHCGNKDIVESTREKFVQKAIEQYKKNGDENYGCDFIRF